MTNRPTTLTFAWWNLHNFGHYYALKKNVWPWPKNTTEYHLKRDRIVTALRQMFNDEFPDLLAVCEITKQAAEDLLRCFPTGYRVIVPDPSDGNRGFQVAIFYRLDRGFSEEAPIFPTDLEDLNTKTRAMLPIHLKTSGHMIRFIACHWVAFDKSAVSRERLADVLKRDTYSFLNNRSKTTKHHVVILGDLNEEPTSPIFCVDRLHSVRDRGSTRVSRRDIKNTRRVCLYNAAWRYLGEQRPHGTPDPIPRECAGTYYYAKKHEWRTFDHVIVSGGLLSERPPYLDEANTQIVSTPIMTDEAGYPVAYTPGSIRGVSDHLPIVGRIVLLR